jgi:predicted dehydrogenase
MTAAPSGASQSPALRIAIAGCGRMGRLHSERVLRDGRGRVTALFDIDPNAAQALEHGPAKEARLFGRFEEFVELGNADAAIICTPTQHHFEQAAAFLCRGIPVLCEKPLARTRAEILELSAAAQRAGTVLCVGYQRRSWASYRSLRRLVQSGEFGPVCTVLSSNLENWQQTIAGTWRDDPQANPGGFIGDAGSHKLDAAFWVTGLAPSDVFARCDTCGSHVEIVASVSALLTGGVPLTMDFIGNAQHFGETLAVHCTGADLTLRERKLWVGRDAKAERLPFTEPESDPVAGFLDAVLLGAENFAPADCALPVFDMTQAIFESARSGRSVSVS